MFVHFVPVGKINPLSLSQRLFFAGAHSPDNTPVSLQPDLFAPLGPKTKGLNRFAVIGDAGSGSRTQMAIGKQMAKTYQSTPFASVIVLGDNVYEYGEPHLFKERIYEPYQKLFEKSVRFYPVMGNHDVKHGHENAQLAYWGAPRFYNFTQGPVEFFALDTTVLLPGYEKCYTNNPFWAAKVADVQLQWLDNALKNSKAPFKVVYGHYPLYSSGKHAYDKDSIPKLRAMLEPLFSKYGVDLYLAGHEHHYERSKIIQGVQHIISGAAGRLRKICFPQAPYPREVAFSRAHFMLFDVQGDRLAFKVLSQRGKVLDAGTVGRKTPQSKTA